jgi:tetratricopeptide (TPR) repeat protein
MKKGISILFTILFFLGQAAANQADDLFQQANMAYQKNNFDEAAQLYQQVLAAGYRSAELEYNLGNAFYKMGDLGKSILHFERALILSPNDADTKANLEMARSQVKGELDALPEFFLSAAWKKCRSAFSSGLWGTTALALWWAGFAGLAFWLLGKNRKQKKMGFFLGLALLLLSILPFSLALSRAAYEQNTGQAILLQKTAPLRSAPDEGGSEIMTLHEGTKVQLLDFLSGWWQVRLPNGERGWLEGKALERI